MSSNPTNGTGGDSFFSFIRDLGSTVGDVYRDIAPIWNRPNPSPVGAGRPVERRPLYQGNQRGTTGTPVSSPGLANAGQYMPWIILGGVGLIAAILIAK